MNYKLILISLLSLMLVACNNPERNKATDEKTSGAVQETIGNITNDEELKLKGQKNQIKGDLRNTKEDVKDVFKSN